MTHRSAPKYVLAAALAIIVGQVPATGQQVPINVTPPTPKLLAQPDCPLQVLSMQSVTAPSQAGLPPRVAQAVADYELVLRNNANVPIMAYAISHEADLGKGRGRICQSSQGFSEPRIGAGETTTIRSHLTKHGTTITPVVDFVLLKDGTYFGQNYCGILADYTKRLEERRATFDTIIRRIQKDGLEKTMDWMRQELNQDVGPLLAPKKMK